MLETGERDEKNDYKYQEQGSVLCCKNKKVKKRQKKRIRFYGLE